eukprot:4434695-Amphidinium_carterae.1
MIPEEEAEAIMAVGAKECLRDVEQQVLRCWSTSKTGEVLFTSAIKSIAEKKVSDIVAQTLQELLSLIGEFAIPEVSQLIKEWAIEKL